MSEFAPVASLEMGSVRSPQEPMGTIGMPVRDHMNMSTVLSLIGTDWPGPVDRLFSGGNLLTLQRNTLVQRMRGDWILFIDDDMVWQKDAVKRILESRDDLESQGNQVDVLGGLCCRRAEPHQPTLYVRHDSGAYNFLEDWDTDIVEVDATGMAFALVSKQAFERIAGSPMPSYEDRLKYNKSPDFFKWQGSVGEDLRFCQDVKSAGGRVFVDTRIEIGHMAEKNVGMKDFYREVVERGPEVSKQRRKINKGMDLPTLSTVEARRRYGSS